MKMLGRFADADYRCNKTNDPGGMGFSAEHVRNVEIRGMTRGGGYDKDVEQRK